MKKKIYLCPKCGRALNFSDNPDYTFQCFDCDKDFYEFEAIEKEQEKLEGVKDYTQLVEASMKIKEIADATIEASDKHIEIKGNDMIAQIAEYVYETIKPILESEIWRSSKFRNSAAIYYYTFRLRFGKFFDSCNEYNACLFIDYSPWRDDEAIILFDKSGYLIKEATNENKLFIAEKWHGLKESMNRMIPYALNEYNQYREKEIEKQKEKSKLIDNFKL